MHCKTINFRVEEIFLSFAVDQYLQIHHSTNLFPSTRLTLSCIKNLQKIASVKIEKPQNCTAPNISCFTILSDTLPSRQMTCMCGGEGYHSMEVHNMEYWSATPANHGGIGPCGQWSGQQSCGGHHTTCTNTGKRCVRLPPP